MSRGPTRRSFAVLTSVAALLVATGARSADAPSTAAAPRSVLVFAAASLKGALDTIASRWTAATGHKVTLSYAGSGALARQLEAGAPADIFVSADQQWMDYVEARSLIAAASRAPLVGNALVLVAPKGSGTVLRIGPGFALAAALGDSRLATGAPQSVPVGAYARAALGSLGVWDAVADRIAGADSVRGALAFVARGEARLGIVYRTDALSEPRVEIVDTFPADSHPPIVYPAALVATSTSEPARAFLAYLRSNEAAEVFRAEGFTLPR